MVGFFACFVIVLNIYELRNMEKFASKSIVSGWSYIFLEIAVPAITVINKKTLNYYFDVPTSSLIQMF